MSTSMTMSMTSMATSNTAGSAAAATTSASAHSGHSMGGMSMGSGASCKISMLWNWTTIDACFLSSTWHITSNGMFAVSCIGVAFLVVALEFMRRLGTEYDAAMLRKFQRHAAARIADSKAQNSSETSVTGSTYLIFRATPLQQLVRSVIHMVQFGLAYIIMLLAMYFNGYIIISIILGAFLGKFLCDWGVQKVALGDHITAKDAHGVSGPTVCCG